MRSKYNKDRECQKVTEVFPKVIRRFASIFLHIFIDWKIATIFYQADSRSKSTLVFSPLTAPLNTWIVPSLQSLVHGHSRLLAKPGAWRSWNTWFDWIESNKGNPIRSAVLKCVRYRQFKTPHDLIGFLLLGSTVIGLLGLILPHLPEMRVLNHRQK